jgi:hypothetical protein
MFTSGYGDQGAAFAVSHLWPNLVHYTSWLLEAQTAAAVAGAIALVLPWRRVWPDVEHRRFLAISATVVVTVWCFYCFYLVFDAWWYLRFMLPALPFIAIGLAALASAMRRAGGYRTSTTVTIVLALIVMTQYRHVVSNGGLTSWSNERRYVSVGRLVRAHTDDNSVIFGIQHSGSLRYYEGLTTIRFDNMDADALDVAIAWLSSHGIRSYLLVEEWEDEIFRARFSRQAAIARLDTPLVVYRGAGVTTLYDLSQAATAEPMEAAVSIEGLRSVRPAPPRPLVLLK